MGLTSQDSAELVAIRQSHAFSTPEWLSTELELHKCPASPRDSSSSVLGQLHYRFANALSLSRENTAEESYLARGKSSEYKQNRSIDDSTDHDKALAEGATP